MIKLEEQKQLVSGDVSISCTGQKVANSALSLATEKITQLREFCPSDALVELEVNKSKTQYTLHLVVRTPCNEISADGNGFSLAAALEGSLSSVHARLREWRKERFACPPNHGNSQKLKDGTL